MSDSSYIARSLYDVAAEKPQVTPLIITEDDKPFIVGQLTQACADIVTRLAAYIAEETQFEDEPYTFVFTLPTCRNASVDALIRHELLRAIVTYVLTRWYEVRLPAVAAREQQLYDAAIAMLRGTMPSQQPMQKIQSALMERSLFRLQWSLLFPEWDAL